jgi:RecB family exonuclease/superfamily I DNA/RNA helicase
VDARLITGGYGSGKTAALVDRWVALAEQHEPGRVLFVARRGTAAIDVRHRLVAAAQRAGLVAGPLAVTTWTGLALDLVRRARPDLADAALLTGAAQRQFVADVFANDATPWVASAEMAGRRAFVSELARGLRAVLATPMTRDEILSTARDAGVEDRWAELLAFADRYRDALRAQNLIDAGEVIGLAIASFDAAALADRFVEVLVDDAEAMSAPAAVLLDAIASGATPVTLASNPNGMRDVVVHEPIDHAAVFARRHEAERRALDDRAQAAPGALVFCRHPSMEADAVVGALDAAHTRGIAWHDMAVVVPRRSLPIARAVVRALRRRDVPVRAGLVQGDAEPVVRKLRAALGARAANEPAGDALAAVVDAAMVDFRGDGDVDLVTPDAPLDRALDALVATNALARTWIDAHPGATTAELLRALTDTDAPLLVDDAAYDDVGVAVLTVSEAAGRHWRFVVAPGMVEGEYPRVSSAIGWFDAAVTTPAGALSVAERRRVQVAEQERRFHMVATRGDETVFISAPPPGVLVSRYVEHLPRTAPTPGWVPPVAPDPRPATVSVTPMHPSGQLRLSASQLSTFEDCPRRWFYASVLRLDDSTSVWTEFGSMVHNVLEAFLDPAATSEYSLEGLLQVAEDHWTDAVAPWKPQQEQAQRELKEMLERWWDIEGKAMTRDQVVAVEHEFEVAVGDHVVRGRIDRVDFDRDRNGIGVVDYKTGRHFPKPEDVEHDLQLAVYYLAAARSEALAAYGPPTRLELLYFRAKDPFFEQPITEHHDVVAEERILAGAEQMLREELAPLVSADCDHCDFHRLCPLQRAGREVGAR